MSQMKTQQQQISEVFSLFEQYKPQIAEVAPPNLSVERILSMANLAVKRNPKLAGCTHRSLIECLLASTQLGLEIDSVGQKAYLVPYKTKCTLIFGYKGLLELARNSRDVRDILPPQLACEQDEFSYELGSKPWITHRPQLDERGEATHYYVVSVTPSGERVFTVLSRRQVEKIKSDVAARTKATDGPWFTHFDDMGLKSAIRRHCKYISSSPQLQRAIALDEQAEIGAQAIDILDVALPQEDAASAAPAKKTLDSFVDPQSATQTGPWPWPATKSKPQPVKFPESPKCERCGAKVGHKAGCSEKMAPVDPEPEPVNEPAMDAQQDYIRSSRLERCRVLWEKVAQTKREEIMEDMGLEDEAAIAELDTDLLDRLGDVLAKSHQLQMEAAGV